MKHAPTLSFRIAITSIAFGLSLSSFAATLHAVEWPQWRGPSNNGSIAVGSYPVRWDSKNVAWKSALPGKGCSTPIVKKETIYLTGPAEGNDALLAFDMTGKRLWQTKFGEENPGRHRNGSGSNASPITDGHGIFVYFKSGTLAAVEFNGDVRWQTNLVKRFGRDTLYWDHGTSPVVTERFVIMARMHQGESWLAAFDKTSGEMVWKAPRNYETPQEGDHGYTTPLVINQQGQEALLVWGAQHLTAHSAADGSVLWSCGDFNPESKKLWPAVASPVIAGDIAVVPAGRNDRGAPRLHGIRVGGEGDVTESHRVWKRDDIGTFVPTPAEYKGKVYLLRDRGELECIDPATGKTVWSDAFPRSRANYYSSPLIAGGNLYAAREDGVVFVAGIDGGFELLAENDMGESVIAAPVPVDNGLLIRGENNLFFVASPADKPTKADGKKTVKLFTVPQYCEGVVFDHDGNGYTSHGKTITKFSLDGKHATWAETGAPNGHKVLADGTHLVCDASRHAVLHMSADGKMLDPASNGCGGKPLRGPNDLSLDTLNGGFYFTDPGGSGVDNLIGTVHYVDKQGKTHLLDDGLAFPNGIVLHPNGKSLLVAESQKNRILVYRVRAAGKIGPRKVFAKLPKKVEADGQIDNQPDGMCLDAAGNLYVAHYGMQQVQVLNPKGKLIARYDGGNVTTSNVAFGGPNHDQLFITGGIGRGSKEGGVFRIDLGEKGLFILPSKRN